MHYFQIFAYQLNQSDVFIISNLFQPSKENITIFFHSNKIIPGIIICNIYITSFCSNVSSQAILFLPNALLHNPLATGIFLLSSKNFIYKNFYICLKILYNPEVFSLHRHCSPVNLPIQFYLFHLHEHTLGFQI